VRCEPFGQLIDQVIDQVIALTSCEAEVARWIGRLASMAAAMRSCLSALIGNQWFRICWSKRRRI
jgi:hypothetical protein